MAWITCSTDVARPSLRLFSISSRARAFPGRSGMARRPRSSPLEHGEAFVRVEDVALHVGGFRRPPPELVHRAYQAHPVQHLLLSAVLDRAQRPLPPRREVGSLQCLKARAVGLDIGAE